jgi:hypothetical protein
MSDSQPGVPEHRPDNRPTATQRACGVHQLVGVEDDAAAPQLAGQRGQDGGLARAGSAGDDEQRLPAGPAEDQADAGGELGVFPELDLPRGDGRFR